MLDKLIVVALGFGTDPESSKHEAFPYIIFPYDPPFFEVDTYNFPLRPYEARIVTFREERGFLNGAM